MKAKYQDLAERYQALVEHHAKVVTMTRQLQTREKRLLEKISDYKQTVSTLKEIKLVDVGHAQVKIVEYKDEHAPAQQTIDL